MKKYLFFSIAALALASCSDDEYVGLTPEKDNSKVDSAAIDFGSLTAKVTRADKYTGADAATLLDNNYVVEGIKYVGAEKVEVFDHYNVNYKASTAGSTESNTKDWEYVGQDQKIKGTSSKLSTATQQTIKYWDYAASQYDFVAVSLGKGAGATPTFAELSKIDYTKFGNDGTTGKEAPVYTLTGTYEELASAYVADLVSAYKADGDFGIDNTITPSFRRAGAKVRIGFYETVPGYAVTNLKFYTEAWNESSATVTEGQNKGVLFTANNFFVPTTGDGVLSVYYPVVGSANKGEQGYNQAIVKYAPSTTGGATLGKTMEFGAVKEGTKEGDAKCSTSIGQTSASASYAGQDTDNGYVTVIPQGKGENLQIRVEYDLYPIDGGAETIHVRDARAVVPAAYADWKSNYAYTYIFKISDKTNGWTGVDENNKVVEGLTPITFDAIVIDTEDATIQETITEVTSPAITTYALGNAGVDPTANVEYAKNQNIYVSVFGETITGSNVKLYTATTTSSIQTISEASVANALANGGKTEVGGGTLTVTAASESISATDKIAATDRPDGVEVAGNFAVFKPTAAGNYVFEFVKNAGSPAVLWVDGETGNEDNSKTGQVKTPAVPAVKFYKVIIIY